MTDAKKAVRLNPEPSKYNELFNLLYADDTLLLAVNLAAVAQPGRCGAIRCLGAYQVPNMA